MFRQIFSYILILQLCLLFSASLVSAAEYEGEGTEYDPYNVETCEQLQEIGQHSESHFRLTKNIDCSDTENWNSGKGFEPIRSFEGNIDGNKKEIRDIYIDREANKVGLFNTTYGAKISNLKIIRPEIKGEEKTGALVGYAFLGFPNIENANKYADQSFDSNLPRKSGSKTSLNNVYIEDGSVQGRDHTGGIVGSAVSLSLKNSYYGGRVEGEDKTGGLLGNFFDFDNSGSIEDSYSDADVRGENNVGGIAGFSDQSVFRHLIFNGTVSGDISVGGITGHRKGDMSNAYTNAEINAEDRAGGIAGDFECGSISDIASESEVSAEGLKGGLIGILHYPGSLCPSNKVENGLWTNEIDDIGKIESVSVHETERVQEGKINFEDFVSGIGPNLNVKVSVKDPELEGNGTQEEPYIIGVCDDLKEIEKDLEGYYILENDIICEEFKPVFNQSAKSHSKEANNFEHLEAREPQGEETKDIEFFDTIGDRNNPFKGILDGKGHSIEYLVIDSTEKGSGIFSVVTGEIKNLELDKIEVTGEKELSVMGSLLTKDGKIRNVGIYNSRLKPSLGKGATGLIKQNKGDIENIFIDIKIEETNSNFGANVGKPNFILLADRNSGVMESIYVSPSSHVEKTGRNLKISAGTLEKNNKITESEAEYLEYLNETDVVSEKKKLIWRNEGEVKEVKVLEDTDRTNLESSKKWVQKDGKPVLKNIDVTSRKKEDKVNLLEKDDKVNRQDGIGPSDKEKGLIDKMFSIIFR